MLQYFEVDKVLSIARKKFPYFPQLLPKCLVLYLRILDDAENYRLYIDSFLKRLSKLNSVNLVIAETEQNPKIYSRSGIEEFLTDGVIVLYNIRNQQIRQRALEILKLRCSDHSKKLVPYEITSKGVQIFPDGKIFI